MSANNPHNSEPQREHLKVPAEISIQNGFKLPVSDIYRLIRSVYESSDTFCASFEEIYPSEQELKSFLDALESKRGSLFLVAEDQGQLLGYLFVEPRSQSKLRHTADLNMGVSPNAQGKGIGYGLLEAALEQASKDGVVEILYLMVRADNEPAIRLYKKHGFEKLLVLDQDTKIGMNYFDGLLMRKFIRHLD